MFALMGDKRLMFSSRGGAFLMYAEKGGSLIALGDPVGAVDQLGDLAARFLRRAARMRRVPVIYQAGSDCAALWQGHDMQAIKLGEQAVIALPEFSLDGSGRKRLRTTRNRALRDGLRLDILPPGGAVRLMPQLRTISDQWLLRRAGREKGFSVGRFDPDWLRHWPLAVLWQGGRPIAFASVLTAGQGRDLTLDLMRHLPDAPPAAMEFLLTELMLTLSAQGAARLSLGMAPLSGLGADAGRYGRIGDLIYRRGGRFYGFEGLRRFKQKFDPDWQPVFLALPRGCSPLLALADAARLIAAPGPAAANMARPPKHHLGAPVSAVASGGTVAARPGRL